MNNYDFPKQTGNIYIYILANLKSNETNVSRGPLDVKYDSPVSSMLGRYAVLGTGDAVAGTC